MSMIKWQTKAVKALINDSNKVFGYDVDIENDTIKNLWGDASSLSCLLYTSPSPRDVEESRMPSSA